MAEAPLPPAAADMNFATPDLFKPLTSDSFKSVPGLEGLEVRDLGFGELSGGAIGAQVFRASPIPSPLSAVWHMHNLTFQIGYVTRGWILYEFEGVGQVRIEAGGAIFHRPRNRLRMLDRSSDFEGLWIKGPAQDTVTAFPFDEEAGEYREVTFVHERA